MNKRDKVTELFKELINHQLKEHGVTFDEVKSDPQWYMNYKTTSEKQEAFIQHIIERCKTVLGLSLEQAKNEANWFILQWGLAVNSTAQNKSEKIEVNNKASKSK